MPRGRPVVRAHLDKARESTLLAVDIYNKPATSFKSSGFIVLMMIAWTSLFHALFFKHRKKPFYRSKSNPRRYERIDGDCKAWELGECLRQHYGQNNPPERVNLEFMIGLRNKIEHRYMPELDSRIAGECQALLINFEDFLFDHFGARHALMEGPSLALQFSHLRNEEQTKAMSKLLRPLAKDVEKYLHIFRSSLSAEVLQDMRYSFKVFLIPKLVNDPSQADLAVEFIKYDPSDPEEMRKYEKVVTFIKPSVTQVANPGRLKAGDVCKAVQPIVQQVAGATTRFSSSYHHVRACYFYKIRPRKGDGDARKTDTRYCHYDEAHRDYVYTDSWRQFLLAEMKKPGQYEKIIKEVGSAAQEPKGK